MEYGRHVAGSLLFPSKRNEFEELEQGFEPVNPAISIKGATWPAPWARPRLLWDGQDWPTGSLSTGNQGSIARLHLHRSQAIYTVEKVS